MLMHKITKVKNQLKKKIFTCWVNLYDFSKVSPSDFLQSDLFQKNNQKNQEYLQYQTVWIQIRSNMFWALCARNVNPDLYPKLSLVDTSR